jgi:uncharacterized integral membrane protein
MSEQTPPPDSPKPAPTPKGTPPKAGGDGSVPWGLVIVGAVVVYAVLFVLFNDDSVEVSFVFFSAEASLVVALALAVALGFLLGFFVEALRTRRRREREQKKTAG